MPPYPITRLALALTALAVPALSFAQVASAPPVKPTTAGSATLAASDKDADAVQLSPFEVRPEDDSGYQAANTTSGSRLNSKLKDTPASVSPFTKEFLADIGATDLESMLAYATNVEREVEDSTNGFNNPPGRDSTGNDFRFRVRGVAGSSSVNYAQSAVPVDLYNIERAEVASGPNSILFGLGAPGGTVALSSKFATLRRTATSAKSVVGSWDFFRHELDHNHVLIRGKLGLRLLGLYQDAKGWRKWDLNEQRRFTAAFSYQPWASTAFRGSYQAGHSANNISLPWNATDSVTSWLAAGRPTADGAAVATTTAFGTANRYTFFSQDNVVYNLRSELFSARAPSNTLVSPSLMGYAYNLTGPGGVRTQNFNEWQFKIEQRLTRTLVAELAYFHNVNRILTRGNVNPNLFLTGDPNPNIPNALLGIVPNTRVRQLYLEDNWSRDPFKDRNEILRLSAAWEVNLGKWLGRHRIAGLAEATRQDRLRRWQNEILVNQNNLAISNSANPEAAANQPWRRRYVTEGRFDTYFAGDPTQTIPEFAIGTNTYHSHYAARTRSNSHTIQDARSFMFAAQSFWWKERLVTTLGYRVDPITFQTYDQARITDANDPRYTSRRFALNEWDFNGVIAENKYRPTTFTAGAVLHLFPRLSLFYNESKNSGTPRLDRTVLPTGKTPPPTEGLGHDAGLMFDVLGDDRLFFRFSAYETRQTKDAAIIPDGLSVNTSTSLGGTAMVNIYNALLTAGRITQAQFDSELKFYNAATIDAVTTGWEAEFVANPTKTLTLRLGVSYSQRRRENFFPEVYGYFAEWEPKWRAASTGDATLLATVNQQLATAHENIDAMAALQNSGFGTRPHKANLTARYRVAEGRLKGAFVGGAGRWQSRNLTRISQIDGREIWGTPTLFVDSFAGYRFNVKRWKMPMSVQLNVRNLFNSYLVGVGRLNAQENGYLRVYLNEPRNYRLTLTADL
ncbi:MAG: TonB-dependent receptor plug domain-containing protein [Verrucomicrobia bacterium]|nr:TonB-dependent receptor plug domain-containing protein [Verrucomicrobiota bacterium]